MPQTIQPQHSNSPMSKALWVILVIIVLVIITFLFIRMSRETVSTDGKGNAVITAQPGKTVKDFPSEFLLEEGVKIDQSFSIIYKTQDTQQPVAKYTSKKTFEENIDMFRATLLKGGWVITHDASIRAVPVTFFYATKGDQQVNITLEKSEDGVNVQIAHSLPR